MVYNDNNWTGKYQYIGDLLPKLAKSITDSGGEAEKVSMSHKDLPKHFFEQYAHKINGTA